MENIKTFDTLEEAFAYKPIWPEYDLQYDDFRAGIRSFVRKQNNEGVWKLIPVIQRYEGNIKKGVTTDKELLDFIKRFNTKCYQVLLFFKFDDFTDPMKHRIINGEVDPSQVSEKERLYGKYI
jgi:hypothetical protein